MATKKRHEEPPASSRNAILILSLGAFVVAGLVVWALTRTVETAEPEPAVASSTGVIEQLPPSTTGVQSSTPPPLTATQTTMPAATPPPAFPSATQTASSESPASIPRIAVEDLRDQARAQTVTIIDVRDDAAYAQGHIPGALHIAFARIEGEMDTLPKNKPIVTYCT